MSEMKIVMVPTADLKPADYNPRKLTKKQEKDLEASIKKFGFVDPIIVNQNPKRPNVIVGGHQRHMIAGKLGIVELPVVYVDLGVKEEKELNLRLNRNLGEFDADLLLALPKELLAEVGFDEGEIERLLAGPKAGQDKDVHFTASGTKQCPKCGYEIS